MDTLGPIFFSGFSPQDYKPKYPRKYFGVFPINTELPDYSKYITDNDVFDTTLLQDDTDTFANGKVVFIRRSE